MAVNAGSRIRFARGDRESLSGLTFPDGTPIAYPGVSTDSRVHLRIANGKDAISSLKDIATDKVENMDGSAKTAELWAEKNGVMVRLSGTAATGVNSPGTKLYVITDRELEGQSMSTVLKAIGLDDKALSNKVNLVVDGAIFCKQIMVDE